MVALDLKEHGLDVAEVHHNLPASSLYEHAIRFEGDASIAENGGLVAYSGTKTGRGDVWWGPVNIPCDGRTFAINRQRAIDYLNTRERLYCFEGFAAGILNTASRCGSYARAHITRCSPLCSSGRRRRSLRILGKRLHHLQRGCISREPPHHGALAFATNMAGGDTPTAAYAAVYPATMLLRVLFAQA